MTAIADTELTLPRICSRKTNRSNIHGKSAQEYYKVTLFIPIIDHIVAEVDLRFSQIEVSAVCGMYLIPKNIVEMTDEHRDTHYNTFKFFEWALAISTNIQPRTRSLEKNVAKGKCWCIK